MTELYTSRQVVAVGRVIETKDQGLRLTSDSGDSVEIFPHSKVQMVSQGKAINMMVYQGDIKTYIKPRKLRPSFVFQTPKSQISVIGTRFELGYNKGIDRLKLLKGKVEQTIGTKKTIISKGQEILTSNNEKHNQHYLKKELAYQKFLITKNISYDLNLQGQSHPALVSKGRFEQESLHFKNSEIYTAPWFPALNSSNFTVSTWIKLDQSFGEYQIIATQRYDREEGLPSGWQFALNDVGALLFSWREKTRTLNLKTLELEPLPIGQWIHLTVSMKNLTETAQDGVRPVAVKVYLDGKLKDSINSTYKTQTARTEPLCLGRLNIRSRGERETGLYPFKGHIDKFTLFNEILSSEEIMKIHTITKPDQIKAPITYESTLTKTSVKTTTPGAFSTWPKTNYNQWTWAPNLIKNADTPVHINEVKALRDGELQVEFKYTHGAHALEIHKVQLLQNNTVIAEDKHKGFSGGALRENIYYLSSDEIKAGEIYQLHLSVSGVDGNDSHGAATIK